MRVLAILIILATGVTAYGGETIKNPIEVGDARWGRDFDASLENSAQTGTDTRVPFPGAEYGAEPRCNHPHVP